MSRGSEGLICVTFWTCSDATRGALEGIPVMVGNIWESIKKKSLSRVYLISQGYLHLYFVCVYAMLKLNANCSPVPCFVLNKTYM